MHRHLLLILLSAIVLLIGCGQPKEQSPDIAKSPDNAINVVTIETRDYTFVNVPDSVPAGPTIFRVQNKGVFPHNASLVYIKDGYTYDQYLEYLNTNPGQVPEWASLLGGPSAPISGQSSEATLTLKPGTYAIVCGVPVPAAEPHYMKGMTKPLTVVPASGETAAMPEKDLTLTMDDYSFAMSKEITAGEQIIQVENEGNQPHEFILARLNSGKTVKDLIGWLGQVINSDGGPLPKAPGVFLNGVSPMDVGVTNLITVDFEPGNYALVCPFPDKDSGNPHFVHGMAKQFSIQ